MIIMQKNMFPLVFVALVTFIISGSALAGQSDDEFTKIQLIMIDHESMHRQLYNRCLKEYPQTASSFKEGIDRWGKKNYPAIKELRLIFRDIMVADGKSVSEADAEISKQLKMTEGLQTQFVKVPAEEMQKACSGQFVEMLFSQMDFVGLLDKYRAKMNNKAATKHSMAEPTKNEPAKLEQTLKGNLQKAVVSDKNAQLIQAAKKGNFSEVQTLLANGANVNSKDIHGMTALIAVSPTRHTEMVKLLLDKGADVNAETAGFTALSFASSVGRTEIVKLLLDKGANVNVIPIDGVTPLISASSGGYVEIVKLLLDKGADVNANPNNRLTALMFALGRGNTELTKLLLDRGADVNVKNNSGQTYLMIASRKGYTEIVKILLNKGADINIKSNDGNTALSIAKKNGRKEIAEMLERAGAKE
jgi:ankyrin repeat protein